MFVKIFVPNKKKKQRLKWLNSFHLNFRVIFSVSFLLVLLPYVFHFCIVLLHSIKSWKFIFTSIFIREIIEPVKEKTHSKWWANRKMEKKNANNNKFELKAHKFYDDCFNFETKWRTLLSNFPSRQNFICTMWYFVACAFWPLCSVLISSRWRCILFKGHTLRKAITLICMPILNKLLVIQVWPISVNQTTRID